MSVSDTKIYYNLAPEQIARHGASLCPDCGALVWDVTKHIAFHVAHQPSEGES